MEEIEPPKPDEVVDAEATVEGQKPKVPKGGSIQTVYKTLLTNLVRLTRIADQKAALMISVNSIIISLIVSFMFEQIQENRLVLIPTIILNLTCILAIVFSILATRPSTAKTKTGDRDLLFFGHFSSIKVDDYLIELKTLMADEMLLQEKIIASIHSQGQVLDQKYKFLKIAYNIFMIGFPVAVLAYITLMINLF